MNAFLQRCPDVVVTTNREKADYIVRVNYDEPNPTTLFVRSNDPVERPTSTAVAHRRARNSLRARCAHDEPQSAPTYC